MQKPKKTWQGLTLHASGPYRGDLDGGTVYFGSDPTETDERIDLYQATQILWSQTYHQDIKMISGTVRAFGKS